MFIPRPHVKRPAGVHAPTDDVADADMFVLRSEVVRRTSSTNTANRHRSGSSNSHVDVDIDDSDMFIRRPSEHRRSSTTSFSSLGENTNPTITDRSMKSSINVSGDGQHLIGDGMEFIPRENTSRPMPPPEGDNSEAGLMLIRWAMQARALLATIDALQTKFNLT